MIYGEIATNGGANSANTAQAFSALGAKYQFEQWNKNRFDGLLSGLQDFFGSNSRDPKYSHN